jgi:hypothetical protein
MRNCPSCRVTLSASEAKTRRCPSCDADVTGAAPSGPNKNVAVTAVGLITLLFGFGYAASGGLLIFGGAFLVAQPEDPVWGFHHLGRFIGYVAVVIGILMLLLSVLGIFAGVGVLLRKPWGRILGIILAVLATLHGTNLVISLGFSANAESKTGVVLGIISFGAGHILYGLLAVVILIKNGAAFSRPHR